MSRLAVRRRLPALLLPALAAAALGSCGALGDYGSIARGNRAMGSGDYEKAAAAYLSVRSTRFEALVAYDLGNVYARLGEVEAAAERYAHARSRGDGPIIRDAWYNEGLALYEAGRFEDSYRAFRRALAIDPADEDARRNLELAYRDWKKRELSPPSSVAPARRTGSADLEELQRLFRRLSTGLWRPGASLPAPPSARDY